MNDSDDLNSKTDYLQRPDFQHHKFLLYGRDAHYSFRTSLTSLNFLVVVNGSKSSDAFFVVSQGR